MGRKFAVDYQVIEKTNGIEFGNGQNVVFTLAGEDEKKAFIGAILPGDQIYAEAGGSNERFLLGCIRQGAEVYRIPAYIVHDQKGDREVCDTLADLSIKSFDRFYPFKEMDQQIAEVTMLSRVYTKFQKKIRIATKRRLEMSFLDLALVEPIGKVDVDVYAQNKLAQAIVRQGLETEDVGKSTIEIVDNVLSGAEAAFYAMLEKAVNKTSVWKGVFEHIPGCGPSIAGRLIAGIGDIRFFETPAKLMAKAGYSNLPDGSIKRKMSLNSEMAKVIRKRIAEASPEMTKEEIDEYLRFDITPELKQAVWGFCDWTRAYGRPDNVWKQAYNARYAYEEARQEQFASKENAWERSFPKERALRWLGQKFLIHIWKRWRVCNAGGEYKAPDFECLRS